MSVVIRRGDVADVPLIAELIRGLARFEKLEHEVVMTEERLTDGLFGERQYAETMIAELDGDAVGFALFFHTFSTFLAQPGIYLEDLYVVPAHRGLGIGRQLLAALARIAVDRGCGRLEWAVLKWNEDAIRFYERLGAMPNSDWEVYRLTGEPLRALAGE